MAAGVMASALLLACAPSDDDALLPPCEWAPTLVAELGSVEDPRSVRYGLGNAVIQRLSDGRVAVMEMFNEEILLYAADGSFLGTVGRSGEGPGELASPASLIVGPADSLWVTQFGGLFAALDPDTDEGRTLSGRGIGVAGIADFTETGDLVLQIPSREGLGWVDLRDRNGNLLRSITGGYPIDSVRVTNSLTGPGRIVWLPDSAFYRMDWQDSTTWIQRWTAEAVTPVLPRARVVEALAESGATVAPDSMSTTSITLHPDGTVWGLGSVRLVDLSAVRPEMPGGERGLGGSNERNEWSDGILFHWDPRTDALRARLIDPLPDNFVDDEHYVTYREDDATGLIVIQLWRVPDPCPAGEGE